MYCPSCGKELKNYVEAPTPVETKKSKGKILIWVICTVFLMAITGVVTFFLSRGNGQGQVQSQSLYEIGEGVVDEMQMYAQDALEVVIANDYFDVMKDERPISNVYEIEIDEKSVASLVEYEYGKVPESVKQHTYDVLLSGLATSINATKFTEDGIIPTMEYAYFLQLGVQKPFVTSAPPKPVAYLYEFDDGFPIIVAFDIRDDGCAVAYGSWLLGDTEKRDVENYLDDTGIDYSIQRIRK